MGDLHEMTCAACGGGPLKLRLRVGGELDQRGLIPTTDAYGTALADIDECQACGHRQLTRYPSEVELLSLYVGARADHYVEEVEGQMATSHATLAEIEKHVTPGRILDLGCWVGFMLAAARDRGWETLGVEPSDFASHYAREELGLDVLQADLLSADLEPASFDAIILGDVIEHLTDPLDALRHIATLLAPGGVLYMALPDSGSRLARLMGARWWSVIPTHIQYFSRESMRILLGRAGFVTLDIHTAPKTFSVEYYLWRIGGYSPAWSQRFKRVARRVGLADRLWTPDFRDRMGVVATVGR
jgi:SAM-dependent methyltransferase